MRFLRFLPLSWNVELLLIYLHHHLCLVPEQVLPSMGQSKALPLPLTVQVIVLPVGGGWVCTASCSHPHPHMDPGCLQLGGRQG